MGLLDMRGPGGGMGQLNTSIDPTKRLSRQGVMDQYAQRGWDMNAGLGDSPSYPAVTMDPSMAPRRGPMQGSQKGGQPGMPKPPGLPPIPEGWTPPMQNQGPESLGPQYQPKPNIGGGKGGNLASPGQNPPKPYFGPPNPNVPSTWIS